MPWFSQLCRNLGLTVHHLRHPEGKPLAKQTVVREVEEERVSETVTLRRTTIEEVEVKPPPPS